MEIQEVNLRSGRVLPENHPPVGNMMQSVVLDGNPLNEDEYMRLLACVVLDGNTPDEVILDLMDLVNDVNLM